MPGLLERKRKTALPSTEEAVLARQSSKVLTHLLERETRPASRHFRMVEDDAEFEIPDAALPLIAELLALMGKGNAVAVVPASREVTPQEAADLLGVSRPFFLKLMASQLMPYRMVGSHKRIRLTDVMAYQQEQERRYQVMEELQAETEALGLYS